MTCHLVVLSVDATDPLRLAHFWAGVLGWEMADEPEGGFALLSSDDTGFRIEFFPPQEQKVGLNHMHFHLSAWHIDIGQRPEEGHVVLADHEGSEFCVLTPR